MTRAPSIIALTLVIAIAPLTFTIFPPMLQATAVDLAAPIAAVQFGMSAYLIVLAFAQPFCGPLSDKYGRRWPLLIGLATYVAASALCATAADVDQLNLGRVLQAIGVCTGLVIVRAIVRDAFGERAPTVMAYVIGAMAISPAIGTAFGGIAGDALGWRAIFWFLAAYGAAMVAATWFRIPEPPRPAGAAMSISALLPLYGRLAATPKFLLFTMAAAVQYAGFYAYLTDGPYVMTAIYGMNPSEFGSYFALFPLAYMSGGLLSGRLSRTFKPDNLVRTGAVLHAVTGAVYLALAALGLADALVLIAFMTVISLFQGIMLGLMIALTLGLDPRIAGSASGLVGGIHMGVSGLAAALMGLLHDGTQIPLILVPGVLALLPPILWELGRRAKPLSV